jgi:hypothetical protein
LKAPVDTGLEMVHLRSCVLPLAQLTPPLGDVTVRLKELLLVTAKSLSLLSFAVQPPKTLASGR